MRYSRKPLYDSIGRGYATTRLADERIVDALCLGLNLPRGATILDVGAGTGKYSRALADRGYSVVAIEPSEVMRAQSTPHERVRWIEAEAEAIPLLDRTADGAIVVLALHHFADRGRALHEIGRVAGSGPIVIFTFEPSEFQKFWLADYFPSLGREQPTSFSQLSDVAREVRERSDREVESAAFSLPRDLRDRFLAACWATPEAYLDPAVRNGVSSFPLMHPGEVEEGLRRLGADLSSGCWDSKYGALRSQETYDAGYKVIRVSL